MITVQLSGSFKNTEDYLKRLSKGDIFASLERYGAEGVRALQAATPRDSSKTANSWTYEIRKTRKSYSIIWRNTNIVAGQPMVILLQYGHGTGTGGYVQGRDFINPVVRPLFDRIAADVWREVTR